MNKVRSRVTSIIPDSLSKWFSPTTEQRNSGNAATAGADKEQPTSHQQQQHNGKRKRSRRRIRLEADDAPDTIMDDGVDAQDLNEEEVQLADNIAEHDLAAEDEQTRRSEYNVILLRKRQLAVTRDTNDDDDDDDDDVEEEEDDDEPDDDGQHNYQQQRQGPQRAYNTNSSGNSNIGHPMAQSSASASTSQPLQKRKRLEVNETSVKTVE